MHKIECRHPQNRIDPLRGKSAIMKKNSIRKSVTVATAIFCMLVQQSYAFQSAIVEEYSFDIADSDDVLRSMSLRPKLPDYSVRIRNLISRMTLEEKVGQMTQLEIGQVTKGTDSEIEIDEDKLEKAIVQYGVGSILNVNGHALSLDKWYGIIGAIQRASQRTRLKIPNIYGIDSIHGANYIKGGTLFPQQIGMAATWNPILMERSAEIAAAETRAAGIPWSFSPVLDIGRQPSWPRFWETFGEDPYLASVMGVAFVRGLEGRDVSSNTRVASSLKHYVGYGFPLSGKDRSPAWIPENYMREIFLPPFESAVKAGARTIMVNSAEVNGIPGHVNKHLLTDILRGEMKFDGFVVSDWQDIEKLVTQWKVAADEKEATRMTVMAGVDMAMVPYNYRFSDNLIELVKEKRVPMSRIDEAVGRILRVKFELGLFENAMPDPALRSNFGQPEYVEASLEAARESMTLLKNEDSVLPISKDKKVLVTGPTADSQISLNNGWTWVWQGSEPSLYTEGKLTIKDAIEAKVGKRKMSFVKGSKIIRPPGNPNTTPMATDVEEDIAAAAWAASKADIVVLCLGEGSYTETPGNISDLTLPEPQLRLAEAVIATGKPVVVVLVEGRPRVISRIADRVQGILMAYNPGDEGGRAVADVLFGDYNPNGRLPFTYPSSPSTLLAYDHKLSETAPDTFGQMPQFEFGHGLSYTTFEYSDLVLDKNEISPTDKLGVSVTVRNSGKIAGKETTILFLRDEVASISPPNRKVKRFSKVHLAPGESEVLSFTLDIDDLSFIGMDNKPTVEPGEFTVLIGGMEAKFKLRLNFDAQP